MPHSVHLQVNVIDVAGDWAMRPAGESRTGTGDLGSPRRTSKPQDEVAIIVAELRGAVEAIRGDDYSPTIAENRSQRAAINYGSPAPYRTMWFVVGS